MAECKFSRPGSSSPEFCTFNECNHGAKLNR